MIDTRVFPCFTLDSIAAGAFPLNCRGSTPGSVLLEAQRTPAEATNICRFSERVVRGYGAGRGGSYPRCCSGVRPEN